jgi:hypothetical protein
MHFPPLARTERDREYNLYGKTERARVVYEYLFNARSHRWLDDNILKLDFDGRGWQSMGILHHLGLVAAHKGIFRGLGITSKDAAEVLESQDSKDYALIIEHLRLYSA